MPAWFDDFPWLHLDGDRVYCHTCGRAAAQDLLNSVQQLQEQFITEGCNDWKDGRDTFILHSKSYQHKTACHLTKTVYAIEEDLRRAGLQEQASNRLCFETHVNTLRVLGQQGLAIRGDDDEHSNLEAFLTARQKDVPALKQWMERKRNHYKSHDRVNEVLYIFGDKLRAGMLKEVRDAPFFALIADETTDIAKKQQLSIVLR